MKTLIPHLYKKKLTGDPIVMVTAYDATMARIIDDAGADVILVGDSLGMVIQGQATTLPVTVDEMIYHTKAVKRAVKRALVVADMPFLSYQPSTEDAIRNAGRLLKEGSAEAVKLEGGTHIAPLVRTLTDFGIPVVGHIGLEPQRVHVYGGYKIQGTSKESAQQLLEDAQDLSQAGAISLVLEGIPAALAQEITASVSIPTIGIASGPHCDGQVLVSYDLWGFNPDFEPKFVKRYCNGYTILRDAVSAYAHDVKTKKFPNKDHTPK